LRLKKIITNEMQIIWSHYYSNQALEIWLEISAPSRFIPWLYNLHQISWTLHSS